MDKKQLRAIGHHLKPVVAVQSENISNSAYAELDRALADHELIKVKILSDDRENRLIVSKEIAKICKADVVQSIGKVILLFRKNPKPNPKTSNLIRSLTPNQSG